MSRKHIIILQTQKPANEVRSFYRMALPLLATNKYHVTLIGKRPKQEPSHIDTISFRYLKHTGRSVVQRIRRFVETWTLLMHSQADLLIINQPENLLFLFSPKFRRKYVWVYDVQENFYFNLKYQGIFLFPVNILLAEIVRFIENRVSPKVSGFILAEQCYKQQLPYLTNNYIIFENKAIPQSSKIRRNKIAGKMLFTGTLSEASGIRTCIDLFENLQFENPKSTLFIVGVATQKKIEYYLKNKIQHNSSINWIGQDGFVDYSEIEYHILTSAVGFVTYKINKANVEKIPSKLWEYMYYQLPFFLPRDSPFLSIPGVQDCAILVDTDTRKYDKTQFDWHMPGENKRIESLERFSVESQSQNLITFINNLI